MSEQHALPIYYSACVCHRGLRCFYRVWSMLLRWLSVIGIGVMGFSVSAILLADEPYPSAEVAIVVPYGEGGATDVIFRAVAGRAQAYLDAPIITVNMPGGGAILGSQFVKESAPDGYTLLGSHQTIDLSYLSGVAAYSHQAFAPVALLTRTVNIPATRAGHAAMGAADIKELIHQHSEPLSFGVIPHSTDHFFWLHFFAEEGISAADVQFVHYPGTSAQVEALLGGELDFAMLNLPSARELFNAGALLPLGVASEQRLADLPHVPTLHEQGIELVNTTDRGLFAPLNTPKERLEVVTKAFEQALTAPDLVQTLEQTYGSFVDFKALDAYEHYLEEQYQQLQALAGAIQFQR
ncbi:tripartite tricarboxylate transporter substrate binding protein [Halomonas sp. 7T]|uniref:Bug family tripartite tricarboxylate transporter substrate binding protein n=1 Tax=Halomonas sp. 7T TaxID=2893469 RepID=UPI0021DAE8B4|nr:tripartite tricarboxylate transporter substrate binding protein [Halomonas sp. 7T]UXZ53667.1 tripartite tricarboxylate transporter substrate binding protein [Halomonas sp. 7T]